MPLAIFRSEFCTNTNPQLNTFSAPCTQPPPSQIAKHLDFYYCYMPRCFPTPVTNPHENVLSVNRATCKKCVKRCLKALYCVFSSLTWKAPFYFWGKCTVLLQFGIGWRILFVWQPISDCYAQKVGWELLRHKPSMKEKGVCISHTTSLLTSFIILAIFTVS